MTQGSVITNHWTGLELSRAAASSGSYLYSISPWWSSETLQSPLKVRLPLFGWSWGDNCVHQVQQGRWELWRLNHISMELQPVNHRSDPGVCITTERGGGKDLSLCQRTLEMTQQHWFYSSLFVTGVTEQPLHEMSKPPGPIILPSTLLGNLSQTLSARCVLQENIWSGEKEETVSTEPSPSNYHPSSTTTTITTSYIRLHIKASHPSLLVPSNRFHLTVAQWSVVFWAAQLCAMKWKPLGWLDHDWGGWKSLVLGFVKQRGASKQTTHRSNFYKLTRPMVECN